MTKPRNAIYVFVAACSVAMAACQPTDIPADQLGRDTDHAAKKLGDQVDKAAVKSRKTAKDAARP